VFFSTKGYQETGQQPEGTLTYKIKLNYIEVPVNILYKIKVGPVAKIHLGAARISDMARLAALPQTRIRLL
jgi:hypothetical protein